MARQTQGAHVMGFCMGCDGGNSDMRENSNRLHRYRRRLGDARDPRHAARQCTRCSRGPACEASAHFTVVGGVNPGVHGACIQDDHRWSQPSSLRRPWSESRCNLNGDAEYNTNEERHGGPRGEVLIQTPGSADRWADAPRLQALPAGRPSSTTAVETNVDRHGM